MSKPTDKPVALAKRSPRARVLGWILGLLLPVVVLVVGAYGAVKLMQTSPRAERQGNHNEGLTARLVETALLARADERVTVQVMGTVEPARTVSLQPQVAGRVVYVHPNLEPGGVFRAGDELIRIESSDYELTVRQREAAMHQAESDLRIEMGQQEIALQDFELLGEEIPEDERGLVLREPQLDKARADLEAARVALEAAQLDLARTRIIAPFDGLVLSESVELGSIVATSTQLATMVGTGRFWVELAVPVDELRWIELPGPGRDRGSEVVIRDEAAWPRGQHRSGHVVRVRGDVDEQSRMATLIIAVEDPLVLDSDTGDAPRLLLNSYVRADIQGQTLHDVFSVPREHLHQSDRVWVMDSDDALDIREVAVVWRGQDRVLIEGGLNDGERLVTTRLSAPVEGMKLRTISGDADSGLTPSGMEPLPSDQAPKQLELEGEKTGVAPANGIPPADTHE